MKKVLQPCGLASFEKGIYWLLFISDNVISKTTLGELRWLDQIKNKGVSGNRSENSRYGRRTFFSAFLFYFR